MLFLSSIWSRCYAWLGDMRALPSECKQHLWQHAWNVRGPNSNLVWWAVWASVVWEIWKQRNNIIFNQGHWDLDSVMDAIQYRVWSCCKVYITMHFNQWSSNLQQGFFAAVVDSLFGSIPDVYSIFSIVWFLFRLLLSD